MTVDLANHLWQSTLCVAAAAILVRMLKGAAAKWRYRIWLAASLKFFVPFALLSSIGGWMPVPVLPETGDQSRVSVVIEFLGQPFDAVSDPLGPSGLEPADSRFTILNSQLSAGDAARPGLAGIVLVSLWLGGCLALVIGKLIRWRELRALLRTSRLITRGREAEALARTQLQLVSYRDIDVCVLPRAVEPGVVGIARPAILWPAALSARLDDAELDAIFAHELQHVHRRDNLAAALHGVLEVALWFHPAIWWIKSRLIAERERACDEAVLRLGGEPHAYARGILKVCEFCLQSPSVAAAAVTGADLSRRMEDIMSERTATSLTFTQRLALAMTALAIVAGPIASGSLQASPALQLTAPVPGSWTAAAISAVAPFDVAVPLAQASGVSGTVSDVRGGGIAEAAVSAAPDGGGQAVNVQTDAGGRYTLALAPGQYELTVTKPGFASSKATIFVSRGITLTRDVRLAMGSVAESIRVRSAPPIPLEATPDALDRAKGLIQQGSLADAERELTQALSAVRAARLAAMPRPPAPPTPSGVVRVGGDVAPPKKITDVAPVYPATARANNISGIVIIDALIGTDGAVKDARVLRGQPLLNQAALDAVSQWVFTPTLLNGAPVEVMMSVTVNFQVQ